METLDDVLSHFGIKGMRWGVRRERGSDGRVSEDAANAAKYRQTAATSGTKALSNKELQALVTRMNLEQQYSKLTTKQKTPLQKGANFVQSLIGNVGKQQISKLANEKIPQQIGVMFAARQAQRAAMLARMKVG